MPPRIRVLVVDASVVVRRAVGDLVTSDPSLELAGTAPNGAIALQKIAQLNPDVVVLDEDMPESDGFEVVRQIRAKWPRLPVVMCSSVNERRAETTMRALSAGASDYVEKPAGPKDRRAGFVALGLDLLPKIKALVAVRVPPPTPPPAEPPPAPSVRRLTTISEPSILAIGCSTGGPNALGVVLRQLQSPFPVPIVIVQHMPALFTQLLAERLTSSTGIVTKEAVHGDLIVPGCAYLAPGNFHMTVMRQGTTVRAALNQDAPENSCRPAVDVLFRSVAHIYGASVLAAVLTGMGSDGTRGARAVVEAGGTVLVQDPDSCVVSSMPLNVSTAGYASAAFEPERLGRELLARVTRGSAKRGTDEWNCA